MGLEEVLGRAGIEAKGERLAYLVMHAELERVLVSGPMRGKETTYALMSERVPCFPERSMEEGLGELVMRYFAGHGPATVHDCAWWSGLTLKEVKRGIAGAGEGIEVRGAWIAASERVPLPSEPRRVQLIPNFDVYVIAKTEAPCFRLPSRRSARPTGSSPRTWCSSTE